MKSFYSQNELNAIDFKSIGKNVLISRFSQIYNPETLSIGNNTRIDDFCILTGDIELGSHVHIAAYCNLHGGAGIILRDFAAISAHTSVYSVSDSYIGNGMIGPGIPDEYRSLDSGPVELREHTCIGAGSVVLPNTFLAIGVTVGAMSLVKGFLLQWNVYAGVPAKFVKVRRSDIILKYAHEMARQNETN